ncbi:MAG: hypothetical protein JXQ85_09750 [Cognatishimia sp.]|uniref:hypothetical protein n=1 Tax=Cognatishimia sp. TaxID=2211648 RepID=UPI003B8EA588
MQSIRERIDKEFAGILPYHEIFYLNAIRNAASKSIRHYNDFLAGNLETHTADAACYEFFSAVTQAASVSSFFWPNPRNEKLQVRGQTLRQSFDPLSVARIKDRKLRHSIVHLDERLDKFCASETYGELIDGFIGSVDKVSAPHQKILRLVDPINKIAILHGYEFKYTGFFESIAQIGQDAIEMIEAGGRLRKEKSGES